MAFHPKLGSEIYLPDGKYTFTEHPMARGMPYGQTGRRATVYQLKNSSGSLYALKVFTKAFRSSETEISAARIRSLSHLPGMQACARQVLTKSNAPDLIDKFRDLEYAVVMHWTHGRTWQEIMMSQQTLAKDTSLALAHNWVKMLSTLEQNDVAHCDISGPNVMVVGLQPFESTNGVALVDLEDLYAPGLKKPGQLPGGSFGYAHRTADKGIWNSVADRFSGMILLSEILSRHSTEIVRCSEKEQYFNQDELQTDCERYRILLDELQSSYGKELASIFRQGWESLTLGDCPSFSFWRKIIEQLEEPAGIEDDKSPKMELSPTFIDFGILNQPNPIFHLEISNAGKAVLEGNIACEPWLNVQPDRFLLHQNGKLSISVSANQGLIATIPDVSEYSSLAGLRVESNAGVQSVGARLVIPRGPLQTGSNASEVTKPVVVKMRGGCLTSWLVFVMIADVFAVLFSLTFFGSDPIMNSYGVILVLLCLGQLIGAGALLNWKKWGIYVYAISVAIAIVLTLVLGDVAMAVLQFALQFVLMYFLVQPAWHLMD